MHLLSPTTTYFHKRSRRHCNHSMPSTSTSASPLLPLHSLQPRQPSHFQPRHYSHLRLHLSTTGSTITINSLGHLSLAGQATLAATLPITIQCSPRNRSVALHPIRPNLQLLTSQLHSLHPMFSHVAPLHTPRNLLPSPSHMQQQQQQQLQQQQQHNPYWPPAESSTRMPGTY